MSQTLSRSSPIKRAALWTAAQIALCFALVVLSGAAGARSEEIIVVVDGSGSIWGRIDGTSRNKRDLIREELSKALRTHIPQAAIGFAAFGGQSGGSCQAANVILAPQVGQLDELDAALDKFNPQGRGPVALGLSTAASAFAETPNQAGDPASQGRRLLLIHDGADNCGQDVCALAADLSKSQPGLVIDVLSIALEDEDKGSMACVTKATGGRLIEAANADEAIAGLNSLLARLQVNDPAGQAKPAPPSDGKAPSSPPSAPLVAGIQLQVRLVGSNKPVTHGITWHIKSLSNSTRPINLTLREAIGDVSLPPGRYAVTLDAETTQIERIVEVTAGKRDDVTFEFAGGLLDVARSASSAEAQPDDRFEHVVVSIAQQTVASNSATGSSTLAVAPTWTGAARSARGLLLSPGIYTVTSSNGLAHQSENVEIIAGKSVSVPIPADRAQLTVIAAGLQPEQAAVAEILLSVDEQGTGKSREIARSSALRATFDVPAGSYRVALRAFGSSNSEIIVLAAGQNAKKRISLPQMALSLSSHYGDGAPLDGHNLRYRLWRADQLDEPFVVSHEPQPTFHLAPGKYRIESRIGLQNAVIIREFDVGPGAYGRLDLRHLAGAVALQMPDTAASHAQLPYWEIFDPQNRLIWRSFEVSPALVLAAGTYRAAVHVAGSQFSSQFAVVSGRDQTVIVSPN